MIVLVLTCLSGDMLSSRMGGQIHYEQCLSRCASKFLDTLCRFPMFDAKYCTPAKSGACNEAPDKLFEGTPCEEFAVYVLTQSRARACIHSLCADGPVSQSCAVLSWS